MHEGRRSDLLVVADHRLVQGVIHWLDAIRHMRTLADPSLH